MKVYCKKEVEEKTFSEYIDWFIENECDEYHYYACHLKKEILDGMFRTKFIDGIIQHGCILYLFMSNDEKGDETTMELYLKDKDVKHEFCKYIRSD